MVLPILQGIRTLTGSLVQPLFLPMIYLVLQSMTTLISIWINGDRLQDEKDLQSPFRSQMFDFIVVGAGSAGSLLANRLSRSYRVLLLEAGGEPFPLQFIPGFGLFLVNRPGLDWQHRTVPQKFGTLMSADGESSWSTGLGLGGTGNLNLMIHLRGHRKDFDNWAEITGDPSWSWEGVLPYFKSYEDYGVPGDNVNHGYGGDLRIETPSYIGRAREFVRGAMEMGYPHVDLNAPYDEGFDIIKYPIRRGVRQSPYKAFLEPIRNRPNLTIMKFSQVTRVLFREGNIAYGVEYVRHGRTFSAHARREVIISSGAVGSPKVLMLSGIGPKGHLQSLNIPVVNDLPVGENLQDHLAVYLGPFLIREGGGLFLDRDLTPSQFVKWFTLGEGSLTNTGCEASGTIASEYAKQRGEGDWPDLHLFLYSFTNFRLGPETIAGGFNLKIDEVRKYFEGTEGRDALYIALGGSRPFSRGYIRLGGTSPFDKLIIDPNYFGDPGDVDLKVLLDGIKKTLYLMENTTAMGIETGARLTTNVLPGCEHLPYRSDSYFECFARRYSVTIHHPAGTAAMGSVVDTHLRVIGTRNLRVVDASIQPVVVVTNTQASTLMIAEKAADMILRYWRQFDANRGPPPSTKNPSVFGSFFQYLGNKHKGGGGNYNKYVGGGYVPPLAPPNDYWRYKKMGLEMMVDSSTFANLTTKKPEQVTPLAPPELLPPPENILVERKIGKSNQPKGSDMVSTTAIPSTTTTINKNSMNKMNDKEKQWKGKAPSTISSAPPPLPSITVESKKQEKVNEVEYEYYDDDDNKENEQPKAVIKQLPLTSKQRNPYNHGDGVRYSFNFDAPDSSFVSYDQNDLGR